MIFWIISLLVIVVAAVIIIRLTVNKNENSDSNLGILEHPSTFEKQPVEYVDKTIGKNSNEEYTDQYE